MPKASSWQRKRLTSRRACMAQQALRQNLTMMVSWLWMDTSLAMEMATAMVMVRARWQEKRPMIEMVWTGSVHRRPPRRNLVCDCTSNVNLGTTLTPQVFVQNGAHPFTASSKRTSSLWSSRTARSSSSSALPADAARHCGSTVTLMTGCQVVIMRGHVGVRRLWSRQRQSGMLDECVVASSRDCRRTETFLSTSRSRRYPRRQCTCISRCPGHRHSR